MNWRCKKMFHKWKERHIEKSTYLKVLACILIPMVLLYQIQEPVFAETVKNEKMRITNTNTYADKRVVSAFKELKFEVIYDKEANYAGTFSIRHHAIILKGKNKKWLLHEMGHFLSHLKGGAANTKKFEYIYKKEKKGYRDMKGQKVKKYVCKNSKEYFAQSFADYTIRPKTLKKQRPKTYAYIFGKVASVTETDIVRIKQMYGRAWGMPMPE